MPHRDPPGWRAHLTVEREPTPSGTLDPMMPRSLVILVHPFDDFWNSRYWFAAAAKSLQQRGVNIHVCSDPTRCPAADASILHVDQTRIGPEFVRAAHRSRHAINVRTTDISKRAVCTHVLRRSDSWSGPVVVKTNRNSSGMKEALAARQRSLATRVARSLHRRLPWYLRAELGGKDYRVYPSIRDVPALVWPSPWLVVERFYPEPEGHLFLLRSCVFFHDASISLIRRGTESIVRPPFPCDAVVCFDPPPAEVSKRARDLGFDYGKFDFTLHEGRPIVFDCNRTPTGPSYTQHDFDRYGAHLADGLLRWWSRVAQPDASPAMHASCE